MSPTSCQTAPPRTRQTAIIRAACPQRNATMTKILLISVFSRTTSKTLLYKYKWLHRCSHFYVWCRRRDSNSNGFPRYHLKVVRLPIPPRPQAGEKKRSYSQVGRREQACRNGRKHVSLERCGGISPLGGPCRPVWLYPVPRPTLSVCAEGLR